MTPDINTTVYNSYDIHLLGVINEELLGWDLTEVSGKALYVAGHENYGHVAITMYGIDSDYSSIIWNITEKELPDGYGFRTAIAEQLQFFVDYLSALRGARTVIAIEINDASYHIVDSKAGNYKMATLRAIITCFKKDHFDFRAGRVIRPKF